MDFIKLEETIKEAFKGKVNRGGAEYYTHLYRVSIGVYRSLIPKSPSEYNKTGYMCECIGLIHDLVEDCPEWTFDRVKSELDATDEEIEILKLLTRDKGSDYEEYINRISQNKYATIIKIADLEDNMNISRLKVLTDKDIERLKKYHKSYIYLSGKTFES